jgi:hypothetical protein
MRLNLAMQRNIFAATTLILLLVIGLILGGVITPGAAGGQGKGKAGKTKGVGTDKKSGKEVVLDETILAIDPVTTAGLSVVGSNLVAQGLTIQQSGGNDVVLIQAEAYPSAYGANLSGVKNVVNACAIPGGGLADLGSGDYSPSTKKHEYVFEFAEPVRKFQIGVLDWGDYLPNGACPDGYCSMVMTAYNANGEVVSTSEKGFHTTENSNKRNTEEYGNTVVSGDACEATDGQPGRFIIGVNGRGITRVTLNFANQQSMDPHTSLWLGPMEIEKDGCYNFLALSTTDNKTFDFSGTADVAFCGGGVWSNHTGESSNNSVPTTYPGCAAPTFTSADSWKKPENLTGQGYSLTSDTGNVLPDPITVAPPTNPGNCADELGPGSVEISGTQCYNGLRVGPGETLTVTGVTNDAVLYIAGGARIQGTFQVNNALIFTEGDFDMNAQSDSSLTPNLSGGPWHGFILWTMGTQKTTLNGGSNSNWTGTFYSPNADVLINGGSDSILRSTVIGKTIDFAGNNNTVTYCDPEVNFVSIP